MKVMVQVKMDVEASNDVIRKGKLAALIESYLAEHKP